MQIELTYLAQGRAKAAVRVILFVIILFFLQFFSFKYLETNTIFKYNAIYLVLLYIYIKGFEPKVPPDFDGIDRLVVAFIVAIVLSWIPAFFFWQQSFLSSLLGAQTWLIFFLFFVLKAANYSKVSTEKLVLAFFYLSLVVFLINAITYPNIPFAWRSEARRDGLTIFFFGQGFTALGGFYYFNQSIEKKNWWYLVIAMAAFAALFLLTRSRGNLVGIGLGTLIMLLFSSANQRKVIGFVFIVMMAGGLYFFKDTLERLNAESQQQVENYTGDLRYHAHTYFLTDFQQDTFTYLFGNGQPYGKSKLESTLNSLTETRKFYTSDLGLTGLMVYVGLFGVIVWILIFFKVFTSKSSSTANYVKAYFAMIATTALTGYTIFDPGYMPATVVALYLLKVGKPKKLHLQLIDQEPGPQLPVSEPEKQIELK